MEINQEYSLPHPSQFIHNIALFPVRYWQQRHIQRNKPNEDKLQW